jgi:hypothetical protein
MMFSFFFSVRLHKFQPSVTGIKTQQREIPFLNLHIQCQRANTDSQQTATDRRTLIYLLTFKYFRRAVSGAWYSLISNSKGQSLSWKANSCSAGQEIRRLL